MGSIEVEGPRGLLAGVARDNSCVFFSLDCVFSLSGEYRAIEVEGPRGLVAGVARDNSCVFFSLGCVFSLSGE